jgi:hypothetical protein
MVVRNVLLEVLGSGVIPMNRDEAEHKLIFLHLLGITYSGVQSALLLPYCTQSFSKSLDQVRPDGAEVVAAPPRRTPLDRRGRKSFIQYEIESPAAILHCEPSLGS